VNNQGKMLSAIREKMFDWKTKRLEKQVAQLRKDNEELVHHFAETVTDNKREITPVTIEPKSELKRNPGVVE